MRDWYYAIGGEKHGPVSERYISTLVSEGRINSETLVWIDGMEDWTQAKNVPSLGISSSKPPLIIRREPPVRGRSINRLKAYVLTALGIPLGYVASYFAQSGVFRMICPLGTYCEKFRSIICPSPESLTDDMTVIRGLYSTAWCGMIIGVAVMGAIAFLASKKRDHSISP